MALYRKPFVFPITPATGMLEYHEALVVACLYRFVNSPERKDVPREINDQLQRFIQDLEQQRLIIADLVSEETIPVYSKSTRIQLDKKVALGLLAHGKTNDLLIYGHDLLLGDRYPANYLHDVVQNAKVITKTYSSFLSQSPIAGSVLPIDEALERILPNQNSDKIPGRMPKTAIGKLAIKAAWRIECDTKKVANVSQVIEILQELAKDDPTLIECIPHGVKWVTTKGREKNYDTDACAKALLIWNSSRP